MLHLRRPPCSASPLGAGGSCRLRRNAERESLATTSSARSCDIEPIQVHDFVPRRDEVAHELLLSIVARVDLCERT